MQTPGAGQPGTAGDPLALGRTMIAAPDWTPTHRVSATGAACWARPDGSVPPLAARLDPRLDVRVLQRLGGWAQVRCSNGWETWVDARLLEDVAPPSPAAPAASAAVPAFRATHVVPAGGIPAYSRPDGSEPAAAGLDPRLPVQVVARSGDWAQVACSNGWTAWVDGRLLDPIGSEAAPPPAGTVTTPRTASSAAAVGIGPFALAGALAVVLSSFLPWVGAGDIHANAWDLRLLNVLTLGNRGTDSGVRLGTGLLVALVVFLPVLLRRPMRFARPLAAFAAIELAGLTTIFAFRYTPHLDLGIGILVAFAGGAAIALDHRLTRLILGRRRW